MQPDKLTSEQIEEIKRHALEAAREQLPCRSCGSSDEPILAKPKFQTSDWWDDPSVYVGCASCGRYLTAAPSIYPIIWEAEKEFG